MVSEGNVSIEVSCMRLERGLRSAGSSRRVGRQPVKDELDFNFVVGDRVACMNSVHWDALATGQSIFLSRAFRTHFEEYGPRSVRIRYGMIYRDDIPVAAVVVHVLKLPDFRNGSNGTSTRRVGTYRLASRVAEQPLEVSHTPPSRSVLICGDYYVGGFHGVLLRDGEELGKVWPAIATLLHKIEMQEGLHREQSFILIKDAPASTTSETRALRHALYRRVDSSPNMVLPLSPRWRTYDDYLSQLNVRYRLCAVRAARDLIRQGIESRPLSGLDQWSVRMRALYMNVQRRSGVSFISLPENFLAALARILTPEQFRCTALFKDETLMGFSFTLKDQDTAVCYCLGWDTEAGQQSPILPSLLHNVISDALEMGCARINFGRTALRAKAQLGAHPEASELWIYHGKPELDLPLVPLLDTLSHAPYGDQATPLPL